MNLLKELQKTAKQNAESVLREQDAVLNAVKENLQSQDDNANAMLKFFGTHKSIAAAQTTKANQPKFIEGEFVTYKDVEKVCKKYTLKFLPAAHYINGVPLKALNDLHKFLLTEPNAHEINMMIIAPASHFIKTERPKKDPVLLYGDSEKGYKIISTWGNDFSNTRALLSIFNTRVIKWVFAIGVQIILGLMVAHFFHAVALFNFVVLYIFILTHAVQNPKYMQSYKIYELYY